MLGSMIDGSIPLLRWLYQNSLLGLERTLLSEITKVHCVWSHESLLSWERSSSRNASWSFDLYASTNQMQDSALVLSDLTVCLTIRPTWKTEGKCQIHVIFKIFLLFPPIFVSRVHSFPLSMKRIPNSNNLLKSKLCATVHVIRVFIVVHNMQHRTQSFRLHEF